MSIKVLGISTSPRASSNSDLLLQQALAGAESAGAETEQPLQTIGRDRRAMVIAVGGTKSKKMFDSVRLTAKYFLDVLEMNYAANLFVNKIDEPGQVKKHPSAMEEAFRLGRELAATDAPPPEKPVNVELT